MTPVLIILQGPNQPFICLSNNHLTTYLLCLGHVHLTAGVQSSEKRSTIPHQDVLYLVVIYLQSIWYISSYNRFILGGKEKDLLSLLNVLHMPPFTSLSFFLYLHR